MNDLLRVAVADDEPVMQMYLEESVSDLGFDVVASAKDGLELLAECRMKHPDLVITDIMMPRMDGFRAVKELCRDCPVPVVFITGYDERDRALQAEGECVLVYLMKPVGEKELRLAIALVMSRFEQFKILTAEEPDVRRVLANRQRVERAKSLLMRTEGLDDQEAFDRIHEAAEAAGVNIIQEAERILAKGVV
ncbi:MAG: response regulator [FCB group bacterium]|jgi:response regulator NasT|nr:response regulator [FCB group bacterium]